MYDDKKGFYIKVKVAIFIISIIYFHNTLLVVFYKKIYEIAGVTIFFDYALVVCYCLKLLYL